jgi:hypothetical protein
MSYEAAIEMLTNMFSEWDQETLAIILESNNYHMESTIEQCLAMSGGSTESNTVMSTPSVPGKPATLEAEDDLLGLNIGGGAVQPSDISTSTSGPSVEGTQSKQQGTRYRKQPGRRGRPCTLPDNFLRPPGWSNVDLTLGDEQLAIMLQNELFRKEVEAAMGADWMLQQGMRPQFQQARQQTASTQRPTPQADSLSQAYPAQAAYPIPNGSTGTASTSAAPSGSSGSMMKAISEMGSGLKQRLSQMAQRFKSRPTPQPEGEGQHMQGIGSRQPLINRDYRDGSGEADEYESMLGGSSSNPMLDLEMKDLPKVLVSFYFVIFLFHKVQKSNIDCQLNIEW